MWRDAEVGNKNLKAVQVHALSLPLKDLTDEYFKVTFHLCNDLLTM